MDVKYVITKKQSNMLYRTLKFIHDIFTEYGIAYFMVGGTLLGAIRHHGIIPHDDDGDLCIMKKDVPKLRKLVPIFEKHGYTMEEGIYEEEDGIVGSKKKKKACTKSKDSCTWFITCNKNDCLGVDLFVMKSSSKGTITYADPYWENASTGGVKCYFNKDLLFPLLPYRFGNFYLYGPNNAVEHLNRCYGSEWNSKGQVLFDHRTGKWVSSKLKNLSPTDFLTLAPPKDTCDSQSPPVVCALAKYFKNK